MTYNYNDIASLYVDENDFDSIMEGVYSDIINNSRYIDVDEMINLDDC